MVMKKVVLALMMISAVLSGCGNNKKNKAPISQSGARQERGPTIDGTNPSAVNSLLQAQVYFYNDSSQSSFNTAIKNFLSATIPNSWVGYTNGAYNQNDSTGLFVGGKISTQGSFNNALTSGQRVAVTSNSNLLLVVYDEFTGQKDSDGNTIPAMPVNLTSSSGFVQAQGDLTEIWFQDSYGRVRLTGKFVGNQFQGDVYFVNTQNIDGGQTQEGWLGWFRVNTCSMFVCN
jgi:hypothetical protein